MPAGGLSCALWQCVGDQCGLSFDNCHTPMLNGEFVASTPLPQPVSNVSAVLLYPNEVLVTGGFTAGSPAIKDTWLFNITDKSWHPLKPLYMGRSHASALVLTDNNVLVTGGYYDLNHHELTPTCEIYDPIDDIWHETGNMAHPQHGNALYQLADNTVLSVGGQGTEGDYNFYVERYDPQAQSWSDAGSVTNGGILRAIVKLPNGNILAAGGANQSGYMRTTSIYHPDTHEWTAAADIPYSVAGASAVVLTAGPDAGKVLLAGGAQPGNAQLKTAIYDIASNTWKLGTAIRHEHALAQASLLSGGYVLLAGGAKQVRFTI
ncbi:MAG: Kelch repeat-containing protein [Enterobacteriaceae bacterium]